mgnify:CR=1 FL=1
MSEQEIDLFFREMADVVPLRTPGKTTIKNGSTVTPGQQYRRQQAQYSKEDIDGPLSLVLRKPLAADAWITYKRDGIQTGVYKNLRLGKYPLEATLNLFRKTPSEARDELLQFVRECQDCNIRSVLIVFGRGRHTDAMLKSYLAQWLPEMEQVQAGHTALKQHGGVAAVYVLLRKSEQLRSDNRERHAARLGG